MTFMILLLALAFAYSEYRIVQLEKQVYVLFKEVIELKGVEWYPFNTVCLFSIHTKIKKSNDKMK